MELYKIAMTAGDTVGAELVAQAVKLLRALEKNYDAGFDIVEIISGGPAVDLYGTAFREKDIEAVSECRAILFGNIGDGRYKSQKAEKNPLYALAAMRKAFQVCTNIRPVRIRPEYESLSPLKQAITSKGMDILIVRDLMGGMINGEHRQSEGDEGHEASDLEYYNEKIIEHSARFAFQSAESRRGKLTSVDKANILSSSKLWRRKVIETGWGYPAVELDHDYVDHAAMELLVKPWKYDVILTSNVFGDILADEAAQITGAPWLFGSAELAMDGRGVYTPNQLHHPRGNELEGKGIVSPYGVLDAVSLMLRYSCGRPDLAFAAATAIDRTVRERLFTGEAVPEGGTAVSTDRLGDMIASFVLDN